MAVRNIRCSRGECIFSRCRFLIPLEDRLTMPCGGKYYVTLPPPSSPEDPRTGPQILKHGLAQLMIHRILIISAHNESSRAIN